MNYFLVGTYVVYLSIEDYAVNGRLQENRRWINTESLKIPHRKKRKNIKNMRMVTIGM